MSDVGSRWRGHGSVKDALAELADHAYQQRVWLGRSEGEMSSFEEAVSRLFDDSGLRRVLDGDGVAFDSEIDVALVGLGRALDELGREQGPPDEVVADPKMGVVRGMAAAALFAIVRFESLSPVHSEPPRCRMAGGGLAVRGPDGASQDVDPRALRLSRPLTAALQRWSEISAGERTTDLEGELLAAWGATLAADLATALDEPVEYIAAGAEDAVVVAPRLG